MKRIEEATLDEIRAMKYIQQIRNKIESAQVTVMQTITNTFIDQKAEICRTCGAQIRFSYQRLIGWMEANQPLIDQRYIDLVQPEPVIELPTVVIPEAQSNENTPKYKGQFPIDMLNKKK